MKFDFKLRLNGINPEKIHETQYYVDSEILRRSDPLVPFQTGSLKRSGITGTRLGTGVVKYTAPYAKRQYFAGKSSSQRGRLWVRRMWTSQGKDIVKNANKILNGR
ncbi:MAG: minor capsid protein [Ruminococcus sp.]|nr:minor capsid protein [Ruminococcus sp.]